MKRNNPYSNKKNDQPVGFNQSAPIRVRRKQSNKKVGAAALAWALFTATYGVSPPMGHAKSLQTVLTAAVPSHPEYQALLSNRDAIGEELKAARGLGLPGVNLETRYGAINDDNTEQDDFQWSLSLRQPLLDGGRTRSEVARQTERVFSAEQRVRDTGNAIGLQVVQAYLEVLRTGRVLSTAQKNAGQIKSVVNRVIKRVKAGRSGRVDQELALSRLYAAQNIVEEASIRAQDANTLYITITGEEPSKLENVKIDKSALPRSREAAVLLASNASPRVLALRHDASAAGYAIGTARSAIMPTLDVELSADYQDQILGTNGENEVYSAMLVARLPLYSGGINLARITEAQHRARESSEVAAAAVLDSSRETQLAWNTYANGLRKVRALSAQAKSSKQVRNIRQKQYDAGISTLISILDAQNEYVIARIQAINESSLQKFSYFRILALTGKLLETYNIDAGDPNVIFATNVDRVITHSVRSVSLETSVTSITRPTKHYSRKSRKNRSYDWSK
ncbi:MAG: TolC family protein [Pseudomonadota bacterium]